MSKLSFGKQILILPKKRNLRKSQRKRASVDQVQRALALPVLEVDLRQRLVFEVEKLLANRQIHLKLGLSDHQ